MKTLILLPAVFSLAALAACQSSSVSSNTQTLEPAGGQARYTIQVPPDQGARASAQPYALQGNSSSAAVAPQGLGYQAR